MTTAFVEVQPPDEVLALQAKKSAAKILNLCNTLENIRDEFLTKLPCLQDEVVIEVRVGARAVSVWAWVVEAACDAEMLARVEKRTGRKDESATRDGFNEGREAAKRQQAYQDGKSSRTVERNAQIINTFGLETIAAHGETLQDKGFWIAAVSADDPFEAIEVLAEKKASNPFMEVKDAYRELDALKGKHEEAKQKFVEEFRTVARKAVGEWLRFTARPAIEQLKTSCPDTKLLKFWEETIEQIEEREEAMLIEDAESALIYAWTKGRVTEAQMCEFTGLLSLEIRKTMKSLEDRGYFVEQAQAWKPAKARGSRVKEWQRTGKPFPNLNVVPE